MWRTSTVYTTGRLSLINSVLTAITIYHMLSLELPPWLFKTITKLCPCFFWRAKGIFSGGVACSWKKTLPDELLIVAYTNSALLSTLLAILAS